MQYDLVEEGVFLARPNRFIAHVALPEGTVVCHVKNTGRCAELLVPGAAVFVQRFPPDSPRKTKFDLIAVRKGGLLVNIDSQAPNKAFGEFLRAGRVPGLPAPTLVRPESVWGDSRFDFYAEQGAGRFFLEVKGVTLEENGAALFPDAPTERGVKHLHELSGAAQEGFGAYAVFVLQMKGMHTFAPNTATHPAFAQAMRGARAAGVTLLAYDCVVRPDALALDAPVPILL